MRPARLIRNRLLGIARRMRARIDRLRPRPEATLDFADVRRRLELLLSAMFNQSLGDGLIARSPGMQLNERSIVLPASIRDRGDAAERYRLLAIEQGARIARGTRALLPEDPLERDLYMIIEGAAIDAELVERAPGLSRAITRMRREELGRRAEFFVGKPARPVEALLKEVLVADPVTSVPSIPRTGSPEESVIAARKLASEIRRGIKKRAFYGSITSVALWDDEKVSGHGPDPLPIRTEDLPLSKGSAQGPAYNPGALVQVPAEEGERNDSAPAHDDTPDGDATEANENDGSSDGGSESPQGAQSGGGDESSADGAGTQDEATARNEERSASRKSPAPGGIPYPEWVDRFKRLEPRYATVFAVDAAEGDGEWARQALRDHAPIVKQLRDRFSLLRARRLRLRAQRSGDELDLEACVNAVIDRYLKRVPSDRLYQTARPSRHSLAFTILVDVSGSTKELLPDGQRILDVERLSVVLASEALASLGDPYSILAFSSTSRHNVQVAMVKGFGEKDLGPMHRRVSTLEPGDNTRLGAAIRHATALLLAQNAQRRVLLIVSDGRPHDIDWYWAEAAVEDSRVAILEARAAGVHSFCVTVDSKEADYLPHLFGEGRYWVLANPVDLPKALIRLIDTIIAG